MPSPSRKRAIRDRLVTLLVLGFLSASLHVSAVRAGDPPLLAGTVRDTLGNLLADVEVLLVKDLGATLPAAMVKSDAEGRFSIVGPTPDVYRLAALKTGYATFVGEIDTATRPWIDLILRPSPRSQQSALVPLPRDASWTLRLPRRSVLREIEAGAEPQSAAAGVEPARPEATSLGEALRMQVEQTFDFGERLRGRDADDPLHGTRTRMSLGSRLGERGGIQLSGRHESLDSRSRSPGEPSLASREAADVNVEFSYDTSLDTRLDMRAFYRQSDVSWAHPAATAAPPLRQAQTAWGYDAAWSKQLDPTSRVDLRFDYLDQSLDRPVFLERTVEGVDPSIGAASDLPNRSLGAGGRFESIPTDDHQVQVAFAARVLDLPLSVEPAAGPRLPLAPYRGLTGVTVGIAAQDTWYVAGPFSMIYGLGYKHAIAERDISMIVPRLGGSWSDDGVMLRLLVSYHAVTDWRAGERAPESSFHRQAGQFGYEAEAEFPLVGELFLRGRVRSSPIEFDFVAGETDAGANDDRSLYLSDGNASVNSNSLALIKDSGTTRTYFEVTRGSAEGNLAAVVPVDLPMRYLAARNLRYQNGRLGVRYVPAGTDVQLVFSEVEEGAGPDETGASPVQQKSVELRLVQDLMRFRTLGHWRLLMAMHVDSVDTETDEDWLTADIETASVNRRYSAGLLVHF